MGKRSRWSIAVVLLLLIGGLSVRGFQSRLGVTLFDRAVRARAGMDVTQSLPDGLHVALCGTGSPLPNPDRAGPCNVVIAGKHMFIVDAGEGAARSITTMGLPMAKVEGVFLTHFHSDHIDGMGPVMLMRWTGATATAPLPVHGPEGVDRVVAGFGEVYALDNGYRTAHHGAAIVPPTGAGATALPFALPEPGKGDTGVILEKDGLKVTAIRVDHGPVAPAVGYRFDYKGRSAVISGDTSKSPSLIAAAQGVDLLVHEALQPRLLAAMTTALEQRGLRNTAQITRDIVNYHATPEQAAESARKAGARQLVLTHIVPPIPSRFVYPAFLGDAPNRFGGKITVGEDGMLFTLPAGSDAIEAKRLP